MGKRHTRIEQATKRTHRARAIYNHDAEDADTSSNTILRLWSMQPGKNGKPVRVYKIDNGQFKGGTVTEDWVNGDMRNYWDIKEWEEVE